MGRACLYSLLCLTFDLCPLHSFYSHLMYHMAECHQTSNMMMQFHFLSFVSNSTAEFSLVKCNTHHHHIWVTWGLFMPLFLIFPFGIGSHWVGVGHLIKSWAGVGCWLRPRLVFSFSWISLDFWISVLGSVASLCGRNVLCLCSGVGWGGWSDEVQLSWIGVSGFMVWSWQGALHFFLCYQPQAVVTSRPQHLCLGHLFNTCVLFGLAMRRNSFWGSWGVGSIVFGELAQSWSALLILLICIVWSFLCVELCPTNVRLPVRSPLPLSLCPRARHFASLARWCQYMAVSPVLVCPRAVVSTIQ